MNGGGPPSETAAEILASPALLFLFHRIEQIMGIRAAPDALVRLNNFLEESCGGGFVEKPAAYEYKLTSREQIFEISKFLTINETYFFREGVHFSLLLRHFLPQMAQLKRPVRVCSAATSTGCEAYSLAMLFDYYAKSVRSPAAEPFTFEIDAFDISAEAVEAAKRGRYTANALRSDGAEWRYILENRLIPEGGEYQVSPEIRGLVRFFPHNIMRGMEEKYDIIFFRNALIYFSSKNRLAVMDDLAEALYPGGLLFLGVSETSSVRHPLLENRYLSDVFYFQKSSPAPQPRFPFSSPRSPGEGEKPSRPPPPVPPKAPVPPGVPPSGAAGTRREELVIDCAGVSALLEQDEGRSNAEKVRAALGNSPGRGEAPSPPGNELAAALVFFLSAQNFEAAAPVLAWLEQRSSGAVTRFLRGEYHFLQGAATEAEQCYEEAAGKDRAFWPAFYRLSVLAAGGNRTRYEYKLKKAGESLELGRDLHYECFMGGFSPDYFRRILERKAAEKV